MYSDINLLLLWAVGKAYSLVIERQSDVSKLGILYMFDSL